MKTKEINFMFRTEKGEDLKGGCLTITDGMNWLDLENGFPYQHQRNPFCCRVC